MKTTNCMHTGYSPDDYLSAGSKRTARSVILYAVLLIVILLVTTLGCWLWVKYVPPGSGYVNGKSIHPAFFPAELCNEMKYCVKITSFDKQQSWSWYVSESVYNSYEVGDYIGTLHSGSIYEQEVD